MSIKKMNKRSPPALRWGIKYLGIAVTIIAVAFAIQKIVAIEESNWKALLDFHILILILVAGFLHGVNEILLGWAWQRLLFWFGEPKASIKSCLSVYGRAQITKYIPGNIFQYPTRHVMGNRTGFHHPALAGAMVYEIISILFVGGVISIIGYPKAINVEETIYLRLIFLPVIFVFPLMIQFFLSRFSIGKKLGFPEKPIWDGFKELLPIWGIYSLFFIVNGFILWGISGAITSAWSNIPLIFMISTFSISWVSGFITPGSPAGLGVREAVMIVILSNYFGEPNAAFIALISRLVITLGDVIFFALAYYLLRDHDQGIDTR
jgi:glycosyltransferase 2 family protein